MANKKDIVVSDKNNKKAELMKTTVNQMKKGKPGVAAFIVAAVMAVLIFSPIDIIPDAFAGAYGAGFYDDIAYLVSFVVSMIVGICQVKGKKK